MSLNPQERFFLCVSDFFPHQSYLLTPGRLKRATLRAWGVGQQSKNCYGLMGAHDE